MDATGNVYLSGMTYGSLAATNAGKNDAWLAKYARQGTLLWKQQLGTRESDESRGLGVDSAGNVYLSGLTTGSLASPHAGVWDVWIAKYNPQGTLLWKRQFGTSGWDYSEQLQVTPTGDVYLWGRTTGSLARKNFGRDDTWVAKYNSNGELLWKQQWGTPLEDNPSNFLLDSAGNVYITGFTQDPNLGKTPHKPADSWVLKYSSRGQLLWQKPLATPRYDFTSGIVVDSGDNIYISGTTDGALGGPNVGGQDAWIIKYNCQGQQIWKQQIGTASTEFLGNIKVDKNNNVYLVGITEGALARANVGQMDVWVVKYNSSGKLLWKKQWGTPIYDSSRLLTFDKNGNVLIVGQTTNPTAGINNQEASFWVLKYNPNGTLLGQQKLATGGSDVDVQIDSADSLYITGSTEASFGGNFAGKTDAWLVKYQTP